MTSMDAHMLAAVLRTLRTGVEDGRAVNAFRHPFSEGLSTSRPKGPKKDEIKQLEELWVFWRKKDFCKNFKKTLPLHHQNRVPIR